MNAWSEQSGISDLLGSGSFKEQDRKAATPKAELREMGNLLIEEEDYTSVPPPLWNNTSRGAYQNQKEQLWHRGAAFMKAAGNTNVKIAELLGRTPACINYLMQQEFMQKMVLELQHENGDATLKTLSDESLYAAQRLIEIAKNADNEETRRKANNDILDRKYGKPNQPMSVRDVKAEDISDAELVKALKN